MTLPIFSCHVVDFAIVLYHWYICNIFIPYCKLQNMNIFVAIGLCVYIQGLKFLQ